MDLHYSDGIAAARTMLALEGNGTALKRRLPDGWDLSPYAGNDLRGTSLRGANMLVPFHEVYAVHAQHGSPAGLPQVRYIAFVSQARNRTTGDLGHVHWCTYTEDPATVPGKYRDGRLARVERTQTFTKQQRGETGTAAGSGDSFGQAASSTVWAMMVSDSMGVNRPSASWRRRRW